MGNRVTEAPKKKRVSGRGAKAKGDKFERELAAYFNAHLFDGVERVTRAPLSGGGFTSMNSGGADLMGTPMLFVEAKRTERLNIREALVQAIGNTGRRQSGDIPTVITRRNLEPLDDSIVAMRLSDFTSLYQMALRHTGHAR